MHELVVMEIVDGFVAQIPNTETGVGFVNFLKTKRNFTECTNEIRIFVFKQSKAAIKSA